MKSKYVLCALILLLSQITAVAAVLQVPSRTYPTIQSAINAASNGDTIVVAPNPNPYYPVAYTGTGNRNLDFQGKQITLKSRINPDNPDWDIINSTIIDCGGLPAGNPNGDGGAANRAFHFRRGEDSNSRVIGFKIINGYARGPKGADGLFGFIGDVWRDEPENGLPWQTCPPSYLYGDFDITDPCELPPIALDGNDASGNAYGGAILCENGSSPTIQYCVFEDNTVTGAHGGNGAPGISAPWLNYTWADFNWDPGPGYRQLSEDAETEENLNGQWGGAGGDGDGTGFGGAIACLTNSSPSISGCIFRNNSAHGGRGGDGGNGGNAAYSPNYSDGDEGGGGNAGASIGDGKGGAIYAAANCNPVVSDCNFIGNVAKTGPRATGGERGLGNETDPRAPRGAWGTVSRFIPSTIAGGAAYFAGGATANFVNCKFIENKAYYAFDFYPLIYYIGVPGFEEDIWGYTSGGAVYFAGNSSATINTCDFINNGGDRGYGDGGAIYCGSQTGLTINNDYAVSIGRPGRKNIFLDNTSPEMGGAIFIGNNSSVDISNANFTGNRAEVDGGAIKSRSSVSIANCAFSDNIAEGFSGYGYGGAIDVYSGSSINLTLNNCSFVGNESIWGGAVSSEMFTATLNDCVFFDNKAQMGGALDLGMGTLTIGTSVLKGNRATAGDGGAINCRSASAQIENCEFFDNSAKGFNSWGGAVSFIGQSSSNSQVVRNCLFAGNSAGSDGGAVACALGVVPLILNSTFNGNTADEFGGAVFAALGATATIRDCIISNNDSHAIHEDDVGDNATTQFCLFYKNPDGHFYDSGTRLVYYNAGLIPGGSNNREGDPLFVAGTLGSYYLSQINAGQVLDSNALNNGSTPASNLLYLRNLTTRTDDANDTGQVDIGYHFRKAANVPQYQLTTSVVGGQGTISPGGAYYAGTIVTVTAQPQAGWVVKQWTGTDDDSERATTATVVMNSDRLVTVEFKQPKTFLVSVGGGTRWYANIADAMHDANDGDIIVVYPGIYYGPQLRFNKSVEVRSQNPEDPNWVAQTVLDYTGHGGTMIVFQKGINSGAVLNGFTIRNATWRTQVAIVDAENPGENGGDGGCSNGGAILISPYAGPIIKNCIIRDNTLGGSFGGNGANADDNHNAGRGGWGGWARGGAVLCGKNSYPKFINCQILNNQAIGGIGGNGGDWDPTGGWANYGGNFSMTEWYNWDPRDLTWEWVQGDLWVRWTEMAPYTIGDLGQKSFWNDETGNYLGYFGDYRWYSGYGGGVFVNKGSEVTFENCIISGNLAQGGLSGLGGDAPAGAGPFRPQPFPLQYEIPAFGGGVYIAQDSIVTFTGCTINNNTASDPNFDHRAWAESYDEGSRIQSEYDPADNFSLDPYLGHGGGVCAELGAEVTFIDCNFSGNKASVGGGLFGAEANLVVSDCEFVSNQAFQGGGLFNQDGRISIIRSHFEENRAPFDPNEPNVLGEGGAMHLWSAKANVTDTNIVANSAYASGGALFAGGGERKAAMKNCLIVDNSAGQTGGAITTTTFSQLTIANCTIADNVVSGIGFPYSIGGGIYASYDSYVEILNSILWQNVATQGPQIAIGTRNYPSTVKVSYSDVQGGSAGVSMAMGTTLIWDAMSNISLDPLFVAGYLLSQVAAGQDVNSPCVDTGSDLANAPSLGMDTYTTRTDSVADSGIVDMGYHYNLFPVPQYFLSVTAIPVAGLSSSEQPVVLEPSPPSGLFDWFKPVTLRVNAPPAGYQILWTGTDDDTATGTENTVRMTGDRTVTVTFVSTISQLTVYVIGQGTVTPMGGTYSRGEVVSLTAAPAEGYRLRSWSGTDNDASTALTNTVTMNADNKIVTVTFSVPKIWTVPGDFTTIQGAVNAAESGDIISVAAGVYNTPGLVINTEITITSTNPDDPCVVAATVIDGNGIASTGVIFGYNTTQRTVFNGITIANAGYGLVPAEDGENPGDNGGDGGLSYGGGMVILGSPTIKNSIIRNCYINGGNAGNGANADAAVNAGRGGWGGWARGAGIYIAPPASPTIINTTITSNTAVGGNGGNGGDFAEDGGDAGYGGNWSDGTLWQTWGYAGDYRFYSGYGGGVFCDEGSAPTFIACNITSNAARGGLSGVGGSRGEGVQIPMPDTSFRIPSYGGGVYCAANSSVTFTDCNITGNTAPKPDATYHVDPYLGHGGGIAFENTAYIQFENCNISDNNSAVGGGMYWSGGEPAIIDSNISGNSAYVGGGIYGTNSIGQVENCTFLNNFAGVEPNDVDAITGQGGAIFASSMDGSIIDSIFNSNTAGASGGGIYIFGPGDDQTTIKNCLFFDNEAGRDGGAISVNWNAIAAVENCTLYNNGATGQFGVYGNTGFGGGLYCSYGASTSVIDSIFWNNFAVFGHEIAVETGFEHDPACGSVSVFYSTIRDGQAGVEVGSGCTLIWGAGNKSTDPLFVNSAGDDFHLRQKAAGQSADSPCVNAGSDTAANRGLDLYTTRTDEVPDRAIVDMGYHYPILEPCKLADLEKDGVINLLDFARLAAKWLQDDCGISNNYCQGADLTFDTLVGLDDLDVITDCWLERDTLSPRPNPSQWALVPEGIWPSSVKMSATDAVDILWGLPVQYSFECVSGGCHSSGWRSDANYTDTGLTAGVEYSYRVRTRDTAGNETGWSVIRSAVIGPDVTPPSPNPMTWRIAPRVLTPTSVEMAATTATDTSGSVQYEFDETTGNPGGTDSGWRNDPCYIDTGLTTASSYCYRVRARDASDNVTGWSTEICLGNLGDSVPPTPAPTIIISDANFVGQETYTTSGQFSVTGGKYWHKIVVNVSGITDDVTPAGDIEIRFICSKSSFNSVNRVPNPITLGVASGTVWGSIAQGWRVTFLGTTIVYDVDVDTYAAFGRTLNWTVGAYDAAGNSALSVMHTLGPPGGS